ncbi:MAG: LodA/GoxA family CTQ-dependent oxidase [Thalassobaculum sp.]|uniref:LodA/GoxA family CTQ-dependent oxidase n=1 Tax=Thalassobaculum sp. TaxID=2022740 RepID=UPI0032F0274E
MALDPNIRQIKVHPAIGLARMTISPDHYVFDPANPVRPTYKSGGRVMRQAVQFRLFAYGDNNAGLYELTAARLQEMGLRAVWSAELANGKIEMQTRNPSDRFHARGDTGGGNLRLVGNLATFAEGSRIPMGELTTGGLFVPPVAGIFRRTANTPVPDGGMYSSDVSDNASDGSIGARIVDANGDDAGIAVLPAWVSVGPQDYAPSWNDVGNNNLSKYLQSLLQTPDAPLANPVNAQARALDRNTLERGTAVFGPGIEFSGPFNRGQFYPSEVTGDPDEIRFMPGRGGAGVIPGGLTESLCSPWQFDFQACTCAWWPNQRPDVAFKNGGAGAEVDWLRRIAAEDGRRPPGGTLQTNTDFIRHVDELGIIKRATNDPDRRAETERSDDIPARTS